MDGNCFEGREWQDGRPGMDHRISGRAIVVDGGRVLLVKHQDPETGEVFWVPPGGGIEGAESVFECAVRETFEETGLTVDLDRIVYLREGLDTGTATRFFEVYILCSAYSGTLTTANIVGTGVDEDWIKEARFLSRREMSAFTVYPEMLKTDEFWEDASHSFPGVRYLGVYQM